MSLSSQEQGMKHAPKDSLSSRDVILRSSIASSQQQLNSLGDIQRNG